MIKKIPIVAASLGFGDIFLALRGLLPGCDCRRRLKERFSFDYPGSKVFLLNSGTACLFVLLEHLKKSSNETEVIIPAYTASGVLNAVKKTGLKPVLCDISLKSFNLDIGRLKGLVNDKTLAIIVTHMFGIPAYEALALKDDYPGIFIIEDCAQAQGSKIAGKNTGSFFDAAIFSFNRGKNLPTYGGGAVAAHAKELSGIILEKGAPEQTAFDVFKLGAKVKALALVRNPYAYGILYPLIAGFKEQPAAEDFSVKKYTGFQAALALELFKKVEAESRRRSDNGLRLIEELKSFKSLIFPYMPKDLLPAFNRLPVLINDARQKELLGVALWKEGFETSRMYYKPLHKMFQLGYDQGAFPNAEYFAEHLLTLPVHPLVRDKDLDKMIGIIKNYVTSI